MENCMIDPPEEWRDARDAEEEAAFSDEEAIFEMGAEDAQATLWAGDDELVTARRDCTPAAMVAAIERARLARRKTA